MNKTIFFALAFGTAMASIACGDDTGTGGSGDTTGATGSTKTGTAAPASGSGATKTTTAGSGTTTSASSGMAAPPCEAQCMNDAGCDAMPPAPGMACGDCVAMQADMQSTCAVGAAFGAKCQANADCQAFVMCTLANMMNCETDHAEGYGIVRLEVLKECGGCGNGAP